MKNGQRLGDAHISRDSQFDQSSPTCGSRQALNDSLPCSADEELLLDHVPGSRDA